MEVNVAEQGHKIKEVIPGSIGDEVGIEPGDQLISINGKALTDIIDYMDYLSDDAIEILIIKENGEEWIIELEKEEYEALGLVFDQYLLALKESAETTVFFAL